MKEKENNRCAGHCRPIEQMTPSMLIHQISRRFEERVRAKSMRGDVAAGYRQILFFLAHDKELTQRELTERTNLKASTVSVALQKMESEGLVCRKGSDSDQRKICVSLTEKGVRLDEEIRATCRDNEKRMVEGFNAAEIENLKQYLRRVYGNLQKACEEDKD